MNMIIKTLYHIEYNILIYVITNNMHHSSGVDRGRG